MMLQKYNDSYHKSNYVLVNIKYCCESTVLIRVENYFVTTSYDFIYVTYESPFA
jgi:hypothetical protein